MTVTVKRLIAQLEQIENKMLEVDICDVNSSYAQSGIDNAKIVGRKVLIFTEHRRYEK